MAPNQRSLLLYENDDLERVSVYEKKGYRTVPILYVNGTRVPLDLASKARSNQTLLSFLRDDMRLTGSKLGCAEGGCGACTVMISKKDKHDGSIKHLSVNACLMPVLAADGCHITTVEGVGTVKNDNLHPIQKAMTDLHGSQCGFCTPGIIVSIYSLYANNPSVEHIEEHLDGNLCRCTGYRPIWDAARSLCQDAEDMIRGPCGTPCQLCPEREDCEEDCNHQSKAAQEGMCCSSSKDKVKLKDEFVGNKQNWIEQPNNMFPKELLDGGSVESLELTKPLMVVDGSDYHGAGTWFKPTSLVELLSLLADFAADGSGGCKIVVGNTEVGIETRFKQAIYPRLIFPSESVESLYDFTTTSDKLMIGACVPLSQIQHKCEEFANDSKLTRTVMPIHDMLRWFASTQIRNVACLGGNLVTASPISDMNPMCAAMGGVLTISKVGDDRKSVSRRSVKVSEFFLRYRTVDIDPSEIVERVEIPILAPVFEYVKPFKQARRREDDISIVTSGMHVKLGIKDGAFVIDHIALAFGGMAPKTIMAVETQKALIGQPLCKETFVKATEVLLSEMNLPETVPGGQAAFRMTLAISYLYKFYLTIVEELKKDIDSITADPSLYPTNGDSLPPLPELDETEESGTANFLSDKKPKFSGVQTYPAPKVASGLEDQSLPKVNSMAAEAAGGVGKPSPHMSGSLHCTGEALYTDDIPLPPGTLQASLIMTKSCGGILESIDTTPALAIPGVVGVFTAEDITKLGGKNILGPVVTDEFVFLPIGEEVAMVGQVLGVVVAETLESAELGARKVVPKMGEPKDKIIVTIDDAIEANSFYESTRHVIERGDLGLVERLKDEISSSGPQKAGDTVTVSGTFYSGAQEHFYLETNSTLAVPSESDTNLTVYCSTQAVTKTQKFCASSTGTPAAKVVVRMKRMGGGFGGKETRSVFASCAASVAAKRTGRPVRITLPRDVDMSITGTRHAFKTIYTASAVMTEDGAKIVALDVKLYNNGGSGLDLSGPVADRALFHVDNCYYIPNMRAEVCVAKTCQPPHTAYRGFGGPQGMVAVEHVLEHLAVVCNVSVEKMRRDNMYEQGQSTHFGAVLGTQVLGKWNVPTMWDRLFEKMNIPERRKQFDEFNAKHKWVKRGLTIVPTKFGIAFTAKYMNQGGALVHLYTDGTVLVSHGGTEMGQGLHTKVCQVAAQAFGIPLSDVYVNDTSSDKVANTIPTAASMSTDMYGMATLDACRQILKRLEPVQEKLGPNAQLKDVAMSAHMERIDLSAHGFFTLDSSRCGYDFFKEKPADFPADAPENSYKGQPFNYFTQGVAYAEVEVDVLSGNHKTLRSDVIVDVGSSINPSIDIGQIEGAFAQGMGWSTIEEVVYADDDHTWVRPRGKVFTTGPGTYKIPAFNDVPEIFNVSLLEDVDNPFAVHSSKAIGEPPFFLGTCVFYAIKDAVRSARKQLKGEETETYFEMRMPASSEKIRMYCNDELSSKAKEVMLGGNKEAAEAYQPQGSY